MTLVGEWVIDGFAFGVGRFDEPTPLSGGVIVANPGTRWLRFVPDPAASPAASFVALFSEADWREFQKKVAAADIILPEGARTFGGDGPG